MADHGAVSAVEIERKYAVSAEHRLPDLSNLAPELPATIASEQYLLRATYFDTPRGDLGQRRLAVRRREGGSDQGWHIKTKDGDTSHELQWPLSDLIPEGLRESIVAKTSEQTVSQLVPIASLVTNRQILRWGPAVGEWLLEIADDTVTGTNELTGETHEWREWEAELAPGADPIWLDRLEPLLLDAGGVRSHGTSKIQRVMGRPVQNTPESHPGA